MVCFINLLIVPVIATYFFKSEINNLNLDGLKSYAILVILNLILTRVFVIFFRYFFRIEILNDGVKYTVIATVSAVLIGLVIRFFKGYSEFKRIRSELSDNDL